MFFSKKAVPLHEKSHEIRLHFGKTEIKFGFSRNLH